MSVSRRIAAPLPVVWELATNLPGAPEVMEAITSVEMLTPGPFGVGTRWRETRHVYGREASEVMEITDVVQGRSYTAQASSRGMHYVSTFTFEPTGDGDEGCEVSMRFGGTADARLAKVISAVTARAMAGSVRKALMADLDDLAAAAEQRAEGV